MTNRQNNHYRRLKRVYEFCLRYPNELANTIQDFSIEQSALNTIILNVEKALKIQIYETGGITTDTDDLKLFLAQIVNMYAERGLPKARNAKKSEYVKMLSHGIYFIYYPAKSLAIARTEEIRDILSDSSVFNNIQPADITAINLALQNYNDAISDTAVEIAHKKGSGSDVLPILFNDGKTRVLNIGNYITGTYFFSNKPLVNEFDVCEQIVDLGTKHTKLIAKAIEAVFPKSPIEGVKVTIVGLNNKIGITDIFGNATIEKFKAGTYHILFQKTGYKDKDVIVTIPQGRAIEITVELEKL